MYRRRHFTDEKTAMSQIGNGPQAERSKVAPTDPALRLVVIYAIFASAWILFSDKAVWLLFDDPARITLASMIKGWLFVVVTSILLYGLIRRMLDRVLTASIKEFEAQKDVARTKNLLDNIADSSTDAIFAKDLKGRYLLINRETARVTGKTAEQALGYDDSILFPPEQAENIRANDRRVITENQITTYEEILSTTDGERIYLVIKGPLRDETGLVIGLFGISRDITERKQTEAQIRQVSEDLRQLNETLEARVTERTGQLKVANLKLEATAKELARSNHDLEQFAYVASHDLQEPVRTVVGFIQLLEKRLAGKLDPESAEFMGYAVKGALHIRTMIQGILSYSRVGANGAPLELVDSENAVQVALGLLGSQISSAGAEVETFFLPTVAADRAQLIQLFQNLIGNAIKYCRQREPRVRVEASRDGTRWRFTVTDNGIGIPAEFRERIFVMFQRLHTRDEYDGTGLGLTICKRIVERHGGKIGVDSAPGGGSTFWFTLPADNGP
jgi:PAS domain S-box-containing protein